MKITKPCQTIGGLTSFCPCFCWTPADSECLASPGIVFRVEEAVPIDTFPKSHQNWWLDDNPLLWRCPSLKVLKAVEFPGPAPQILRPEKLVVVGGGYIAWSSGLKPMGGWTNWKERSEFLNQREIFHEKKPRLVAEGLIFYLEVDLFVFFSFWGRGIRRFLPWSDSPSNGCGILDGLCMRWLKDMYLFGVIPADIQRCFQRMWTH